MAYTLHPATLSDAADIARIFQSAFKGDHILSYFYPHTPEQLKWEEDLRFFTEQITNSPKFGGRFTKAIEASTGETVAFSKWDYPVELTKEQKEEKLRKQKEGRGRNVEGSNQALLDEYFEYVRRGRERWILEGKTFFLHILAVHPTHQRRGLGSLLIRPGLAAADSVGKKAYVEASPAGLPLYMKFGWQLVDEMIIDMRPHGGTGNARQALLIREPGSGGELREVDK